MIRDPCILTPVGWKCVLIATVVFFSDGGLFFMHLAIFIERLMATYYADRYEKFSGRNGAVGTVFLVGFTFLFIKATQTNPKRIYYFINVLKFTVSVSKL